MHVNFDLDLTTEGLSVVTEAQHVMLASHHTCSTCMHFIWLAAACSVSLTYRQHTHVMTSMLYLSARLLKHPRFKAALNSRTRERQMLCWLLQAVFNDFEEGDVVWCQDYHLMLLPALLKARHPKMKVSFQ